MSNENIKVTRHNEETVGVGCVEITTRVLFCFDDDDGKMDAVQISLEPFPESGPVPSGDWMIFLRDAIPVELRGDFNKLADYYGFAKTGETS